MGFQTRWTAKLAFPSGFRISWYWSTRAFRFSSVFNAEFSSGSTTYGCFLTIRPLTWRQHSNISSKPSFVFSSALAKILSSRSRASDSRVMDLVRLVNSFSTARNSEGAPDLPEVKAQPSFQASCDSNMMSPTEGSGAIVDDCGGKEKSKTSKMFFLCFIFLSQTMWLRRTELWSATLGRFWRDQWFQLAWNTGLCSKLGTDQVDGLICFAWRSVKPNGDRGGEQVAAGSDAVGGGGTPANQRMCGLSAGGWHGCHVSASSWKGRMAMEEGRRGRGWSDGERSIRRRRGGGMKDWWPTGRDSVHWLDNACPAWLITASKSMGGGSEVEDSTSSTRPRREAQRADLDEAIAIRLAMLDQEKGQQKHRGRNVCFSAHQILTQLGRAWIHQSHRRCSKHPPP